MDGTVYVLTNPAMPDLVKIGKTTRDVSLRLSDLYTTGVPLPFECEYAAKVRNVDETEKAFHEAFGPNRINIKRHCFVIDHHFDHPFSPVNTLDKSFFDSKLNYEKIHVLKDSNRKIFFETIDNIFR